MWSPLPLFLSFYSLQTIYCSRFVCVCEWKRDGKWEKHHRNVGEPCTAAMAKCAFCCCNTHRNHRHRAFSLSQQQQYYKRVRTIFSSFVESIERKEESCVDVLFSFFTHLAHPFLSKEQKLHRVFYLCVISHTISYTAKWTKHTHTPKPSSAIFM